jgi:hypothetical protein
MGMEDFFDKDDELRRLMREEGLLTTSPDFTQRIMRLVAESSQKAGNDYKPLLSRKAWLLLFSFIVVLIVICWQFFARENSDESFLSGTLRPLLDYLGNMDFSVRINPGGLVLASIAIATIGFLLSLDLWLSHKFGETSAWKS